MSLNQQAQLQNRHDQEHVTGQLTIVDPTCVICNPVSENAGHPFLAYWRWLTRDLANPYTYSQVAIRNYTTANETRRRIQQQGRLLADDKNVFLEFKAILNGIRFIRVPAYTASDITYFTLVTSLLSDGFTNLVPERTFRRVLNGENPVGETHPLKRVFDIIRNVRANIGQETRSTTNPDPENRTSTPDPEYRRRFVNLFGERLVTPAPTRFTARTLYNPTETRDKERTPSPTEERSQTPEEETRNIE